MRGSREGTDSTSRVGKQADPDHVVLRSTRTVPAQAWNKIEVDLRTLTLPYDMERIKTQLATATNSDEWEAFIAGTDWSTTPRRGSVVSRDQRSLGRLDVTATLVHLRDSAIRHAGGLINSVFDSPSFDPLLVWTLARTVVESSAAIAWLLMPPDDQERWSRMIRWHLRDAQSQDLAAMSTGKGVKSGKSQNRLLELAGSVGVTIDKRRLRLPTSEVVGWLDMTFSNRARTPRGQQIQSFRLMWNLASGLQHGMSWATDKAFPQTQNPSSDDAFLPVSRACESLGYAHWAWHEAMTTWHRPTARGQSRERRRHSDHLSGMPPSNVLSPHLWS
jgi:hypothetical protein